MLVFKHGDSKGENEKSPNMWIIKETIIYNVIELSMKKEMCKTGRTAFLQKQK